MYVLCSSRLDGYLCSIDSDGILMSGDLSKAIHFEYMQEAMLLVAFLFSFLDSNNESFYIQKVDDADAMYYFDLGGK